MPAADADGGGLCVHVNDGPSAGFSGEDLLTELLDSRERGGVDDGVELIDGEIRGDAPPDGAAGGVRGADGVDAEQIDAAEDEGEDGGAELGASGKAAGGDAGSDGKGADNAGEGIASGAIDGSGPAFRVEGLAGAGEDFAGDDFRGSERFEVIGLGGASGGGDDGVAEFGQDGDGDAADAAGGSGDDDRLTAGLEAVGLEGHYGLHGGEAGGADAHCLLEGESPG